MGKKDGNGGKLKNEKWLNHAAYGNRQKSQEWLKMADSNC